MPNPLIQNPPASRAASRIRSSVVCSNHRSMSCVATSAPSITAAPIPTTTKRTPRVVSAAKSACSAGVSAKSSTGEAAAKPFGRGEFLAAKSVVHVPRVGTGNTNG